MKAQLLKLRAELGPLGAISLGVIALAASFSLAVLGPMAERRDRLNAQLAKAPVVPGAPVRAAPALPSSRMDTFYRFFDRPEGIDEWLAKIYGISIASGVALRSGSYQLAVGQHRLDRYRMTLPVSGTYGQVRAFMQGVLAEVPVASLDQVSFRRKSANEAQVEAEVTLTLHLLRK